MIRRLLAPLLLPLLLLAASAYRVEVRVAPDGGTALIASDAITAGPALPGTAAASTLAALDASAPARVLQRHRAAVQLHARGACTQARAERLARAFLSYVRDLEHARLGTPVTLGNPPPASAS